MTGDVGTNLLAVRALRSDPPLLTTVSASVTISQLELELRRTSLLHCNFATVSSQFKLDIKEGATTNEIKREPEQKQGGGCSRVASQHVSCYS